MQNLMVPVGAIHSRGLVKLRVDARHGRQVYDGVPANGLPQLGNHQHALEVLIAADKEDRLSAKGLDDHVDQAAVHAGNGAHNAAYHHGGQEMRQIRNGLNRLFVDFSGNRVQQNRQQDGRGEAYHQLFQADEQAVADQPPGVNGLKEPAEPV